MRVSNLVCLRSWEGICGEIPICSSSHRKTVRQTVHGHWPSVVVLVVLSLSGAAWGYFCVTVQRLAALAARAYMRVSVAASGYQAANFSWLSQSADGCVCTRSSLSVLVCSCLWLFLIRFLHISPSYPRLQTLCSFSMFWVQYVVYKSKVTHSMLVLDARSEVLRIQIMGYKPYLLSQCDFCNVSFTNLRVQRLRLSSIRCLEHFAYKSKVTNCMFVLNMSSVVVRA